MKTHMQGGGANRLQGAAMALMAAALRPLGLVLAALLLIGQPAWAATKTTTTLTSSLNPMERGQSTVLSAAVSPAAATGTITFKDGNTVLGTASLSAGIATLSTSFSTGGSHSLTAVYGGNSTYGASTSTALAQTVTAQATTVTMLSDANPSGYAQSVNLTATVSPSSATGSVSFKDGTTNIATANLVNGQATGKISFNSVGPHSLTAVYAGNASYATSTSAAYVQTVNPLATATTLTSSANPSNYAQTLTLTASVSPAGATGSVTFKDGSTVLGTANLASGQATLSTSFSTTGAHSLTAVYNGNTNYTTSTSAALTQTVKPLNTSVTVASSVNPSTYNQTTTLTATVNPAAATGTITFKDGTTVLGSAPLSAGKATLATSFGVVGSHSLTVSYAGDDHYNTSTSAALTQTVKAQATTTTLASSTNPAYYAQPLTLTATVTPASATGTVTFRDGATALGTGTLNGGVATLSTGISNVGARSLTAVYAGDGNSASSTSATLTQTINANPTTTTISANPSPSAVNQNTVLTATVSPAAATGSITFKDGSTTLGSATLSGGSATLGKSFSTTGTHTLSAVYAGATGYNTSTGTLSHTVGTATATTTTLASNPNPSTTGQNVTLTANVSPAAATGTVTFKDGSTTLGSASITAGQATLATSFGTTGSHSLTAVYAGAGLYTGSTSTAVVQTVTAPVAQATTTTLASSANPSTTGQSVTLTASVSPATATGTVTFKDGSTTLGTANLTSGQATLATSFGTNGNHSLTAVYAGSSAYNTSTSAVLVQSVAISVGLPAEPSSPTPVINYQYDAQGNPTVTTVAPGSLSLSTTTAYDALSRPKTLTDASNGTTQLAYDGQNNVTQVTDPRSLVTQTPRNGFGQAQQLNSPDTGTATMSYDPAGNLSIRTDSRGVTANYSYDDLDRLTLVSYTLAGQPSQSYQWTYDQTGPGFSYGIGRLTTATFPEGSTSYAYDAFGRVVRMTQTLNPAPAGSGGNSASVIQSVSYGYDAAGHVTSVTYPSGRQLVIGYSGGLPSSVSLATSAGASATPLMTDLQYAPFGPLKSWNWQTDNGPLAQSRTYDLSGRPVRYTLGSYLRDLSYDAAGRITSYTHYQRTTTPGQVIAQTSLNQSFGYDNLGRLTQVTGTPNSWSYTYDANGNRTSTAVNGGAPAAHTIDTASNRLLAIASPPTSLSYDAAGNAVSDSNYTLGYDLRGRLKSLTYSGIPTSYTYDNAGQRVRKISAYTSDATLFVYDQQGHLLGEYDPNGQPIREYAWLGDQPIAVITPDPANAANPKVYYIHADHLNTPRVITDKAGNERWTWWAEPFGTDKAKNDPSSLGAFTMALRFPGQYYDIESGMHYNYQRDYIPGAGRYAQSDPIGLAGGINTYVYVQSNPTSFVDPLGLADLNFFGPRSPMRPYGDAVPSSPRTYTVVGHGNAVNMLDASNKPLSPRQLADLIKNDPSSVGKTVELYACNTGTTNAPYRRDGGSFAGDLARALGQPVSAPDNFVWFGPNGVTGVYPELGMPYRFFGQFPDRANPGTMRTFGP